MKRPRRWINVNGKVNTLRGHFAELGYKRSKACSAAKSYGVKESELPLEALSDIFGCQVTEEKQPDNWQEIMYGSNRGAQKDVPKGKPKATYAQSKSKEVEFVVEPVVRFMSMQLTGNPCQLESYY